MKKKTLIVILTLALAVGTFFATKKLTPYIMGLFFNCKHLTQEECAADNRCEPIYESLCTRGTFSCPPESQYRGCRNLSLERQKEIQEGRLAHQKEYAKKSALCIKFGAYYDESRQGCACPIPSDWQLHNRNRLEILKNGGPQDFVENEGCRTAKEICEARGGQWKDSFEPLEVVEAQHKVGKPKESCYSESEDDLCYDYPNRGQYITVRCFYRWNETLNRCDLVVYKKDEMDQPCKIGKDYFDTESLFRMPPTPQLPSLPAGSAQTPD